MSTFLGPIHYMMYDKIRRQEDFCTYLLEAAASEKMREKIRSRLEESYGTNECKPLEQVIDTGNIHGWIQKRIDRAESRLALAVRLLIEEAGVSTEDLKQYAFTFGTHSALEKDTSPEEAFKTYNTVFLDGMPCDRINEITEQSDSAIAWRRTRCVHRQYWDNGGADINDYYALRSAWLQGMFSGSNLRFDNNGELYRITRKVNNVQH